jgi:hypothetical protein
MNSKHEFPQSLPFNIAGVTPAYDFHEADTDCGFDETSVVMIHLQTPTHTKGAAQHGVIHIKGSRDLQSTTITRIDDESSPGIGLATSTPNGLVIQTVLPFDAAWNIVNAIGSGLIKATVVHLDRFDDGHDRAFLRGLEFRAA